MERYRSLNGYIVESEERIRIRTGVRRCSDSTMKRFNDSPSPPSEQNNFLCHSSFVMEPAVMAKFKFVLLITLLMALLTSVNAGTYTLTDGQTVTGDPISFDANGVVLRLGSGGFSPRTPWGKFTQESLKELQSEARNEDEAEFISPFLEETAAKEAQQKQQQPQTGAGTNAPAPPQPK